MKLRHLMFILAVCILFSSCASHSSRISVAEGTVAQPNLEEAAAILYISTSVKKIHYKSDCRNLKQTKKENITPLKDTPENREMLQRLEFTPCNNCRFPDYLT